VDNPSQSSWVPGASDMLTANERMFVVGNPMADYGAEPTPESPVDEACERRFWPVTVGRRSAAHNPKQ